MNSKITKTDYNLKIILSQQLTEVNMKKEKGGPK